MESFEKEEAIMRIKSEIPNFSEQELIEYTKIAIQNVHTFLCKGKLDKTKKYCSQELLKKFEQNKELYRISENVDTIRVGYARLEGYINEDNKVYVKVYASVFFYDDVDNNNDSEDAYDKYWNDIWVVTFEVKGDNSIMNKCPACGANMEYNIAKHMFTCGYCRNSIYYSQINWKMVDIDVNGIIYK